MNRAKSIKNVYMSLDRLNKEDIVTCIRINRFSDELCRECVFWVPCTRYSYSNSDEAKQKKNNNFLLWWRYSVKMIKSMNFCCFFDFIEMMRLEMTFCELSNAMSTTAIYKIINKYRIVWFRSTYDSNNNWHSTKYKIFHLIKPANFNISFKWMFSYRDFQIFLPTGRILAYACILLHHFNCDCCKCWYFFLVRWYRQLQQ